MPISSDISTLDHAAFEAQYGGPLSHDAFLQMRLTAELLPPVGVSANAFGADPTGVNDSTAAIQAALDAAEANGGGAVLLGIGTYKIVTINSPASGDKAAGAYGIEIPSNVSLIGSGPATILSIVSGGSFGVGVGISPKGMRTATTDFGASSNVRLANFTIQAATQEDSNGNLVNLVHASDWLLERVIFNGSYYHGLEVDQSRRITLKHCTFQGSYSYGASGSWVQFDLGLAGPVNRPAGITTTAVEDITFEDCYFKQRPGTDASPRDIDLTHGSTVILRRVKFVRCLMEGRNVTTTAIAGIDNAANTVDSLDFVDCAFVTAHPGAWGFYFANAGATVYRLGFERCEFRGPSALMLAAGGSTSMTYNATHAQRHHLIVRDCRFLFDKTQMPTLLDVNLILVRSWVNADITGNYIRGIGDFPVSVGSSYSYVTSASNCLALSWDNNLMVWEGNNTFATSRTAMYLHSVESDNAGTTLVNSVQNNRIYSTAGTGYSYGMLVASGTTIPARRAAVFTGNASNCANSAGNNVALTGTTSGGAPTSGGLSLAVRSTTSSTTATQQDGVILADTTSGSITITLPEAQDRGQYRDRGHGITHCGEQRRHCLQQRHD